MTKVKPPLSPMYWKVAIGRSREMKEWRKCHGLTQVEFARALGMSLRSVKYHETLTHGCQIGNYRRFEAIKQRYQEEMR